MRGLFEVSFASDCVLLGVMRGLTLTTSEGLLPVMALRKGSDCYVVAGSFVLLDSDAHLPVDGHWSYMGREGSGLESLNVRRFESIEALGGWLAGVRGTWHPAFCSELIV